MRLYHVDAFTDKPFAGNPAAVCRLSEPQEDAWMLNVAREMNLSETAFVLPQDDRFSLRWFTPKVEVNLCGHATLASAHILWEEKCIAPDATIRFSTRSGLLTAERRGDWIELNFPARETHPGAVPPAIIEALGVTPKHTETNELRYLVELESEQAVRNVHPDFARLAAQPGRCLMVTSRADSMDFDFVSRYFGPWIGINEDPVTGSAHCYLATYWNRKLGKTEFRARQVSARGGILRVRLDGERVRIAGQAVTIARGELL